MNVDTLGEKIIIINEQKNTKERTIALSKIGTVNCRKGFKLFH